MNMLAKFVQIACMGVEGSGYLYALDEEGQVWANTGRERGWVLLSDERKER